MNEENTVTSPADIGSEAERVVSGTDYHKNCVDCGNCKGR